MYKPAIFLSCLTLAFASVSPAKVVFKEDSEYYQPFKEDNYGVSNETEINSAGSKPWTDNATVVGWYAIVDEQTPAEYKASNGNNQSGAPGIFLFRPNGSDASFGTIRASSNAGFTAIGLELGNETGSVITGFNVSYVGQQWQHNSGGKDKLTFQYSTDATTLDSGNWTTVDDLSFESLQDSGSSDHVGLTITTGVPSTDVSAKIKGLRIRSGQSIWFRWVDEDNEGVDQAMSIDLLSIRPILSR